MAEKEPQFTVTDRRKFTLEGDLRDEDAKQRDENRASENRPSENRAFENRSSERGPTSAPLSAGAVAPASAGAQNAGATGVVDRIHRPDVSPPTQAAPNGGEEDLEEGMAEGTIPEPTAEESAQQNAAYQASSKQLDNMLRQANPAGAAEAAGVQMNFDRLVQSIYMTAAVQMGAGTAPNEQPRIDILGARQSIDMLSVLEEKTKGNLSENEKRLLQNALFDLRMSFLEITNAIASSAQRPPKAAKPR